VVYFAVSECRHGVFLDALDGDEMRAVLPELLSVLDAVGGLDMSDSYGYGGWSPDQRGSHATWADALLSINDDRPRDWQLEASTRPVSSWHGIFRRRFCEAARGGF
jgi:hypothetical protein